METKVGEGHLCSRDQAGDEILEGNGRRFEVSPLCRSRRRTSRPFVGLLQAEAVGHEVRSSGSFAYNSQSDRLTSSYCESVWLTEGVAT